MRETKELMKSILNGKEKEKDEYVLIKQYQEDLSPNILAYFYCKHFGLITIQSNKFQNIDNSDKASFCLQELDKALRNYDTSSNNKFLTYFIRCYKNRLIVESKSLEYNKRKIHQNCCELVENLNGNELSIEDTDLLLNEYDLTKEEKLECKLLNEGYSLTEIARKFKITTSAVSQHLKLIRKKILLST